jgi:hypothetical protein
MIISTMPVISNSSMIRTITPATMPMISTVLRVAFTDSPSVTVGRVDDIVGQSAVKHLELAST